MTHPFDLYFRKHDHYPRVGIDSGACRITVTFAPGYVTITQSHPYASEIYITRSAWIQLLRKAIPLTRKWTDHIDFDVPAALREASRKEQLHLAGKRLEKKNRVSGAPESSQRDAQRQRFLRAKARGKSRQVEDERLQGEYDKWTEMILGRRARK